MALSSLRQLVDDRMAGNLDTVLLSWRDSGRSYRDIAELVEWQTGVSVSKSTIYQWLVLQG